MKFIKSLCILLVLCNADAAFANNLPISIVKRHDDFVKEYRNNKKQLFRPKLQIDDYNGIAFIAEDVNLGIIAAVVCGGINRARLGKKGAIYCKVFFFAEVLGRFAKTIRDKKIKEVEYINELFKILREIVNNKTVTNHIFDDILFPFAQEKKIPVKFKKLRHEGRYVSHLAAYLTFWLDWLLPIRSWFYGKGTIQLNKNLIETKPKEYVAGVLAHELFHAYDDLLRGPWPSVYTTIEEEVAAWDVSVYIWDELEVNNNIRHKFLWEEVENNIKVVKEYIFTLPEFCGNWKRWEKNEKIKLLRDTFKVYRKLRNEKKDYWWGKYEENENN